MCPHYVIEVGLCILILLSLILFSPYTTPILAVNIVLCFTFHTHLSMETLSFD